MNSGDHVRHNRTFWDADSDAYQAAHGAGLAAEPLAWGAYRAPEAQIGAPAQATTRRRGSRGSTMMECNPGKSAPPPIHCLRFG